MKLISQFLIPLCFLLKWEAMTTTASKYYEHKGNYFLANASNSLEQCGTYTVDEDFRFPLRPPTGIFVLFGSRAFFRSYHQIFHGRPAHSFQELAHLCPIALFLDGVVTQIASDKKILVGTSQMDPTIESTFFAKSPSVTPETRGTLTPVWTTEEHLLLVACTMGEAHWVLFSLAKPTVTVKRTVLEKIEELGFNSDWAIDLTSDSGGSTQFCSLTPPSRADVALKALKILDIWNRDGDLYKIIDPPISSMDETFNRLLNYYVSFL